MKLFQKVAVRNPFNDVFNEDHFRYGRIVGQACINIRDQMRSTFVVELDQGFYSKDEKSFVSLLIADESNITALE